MNDPIHSVAPAQPMTPLQALQILDAATTPANIPKLNRADFASVQMALEVLARLVSPQVNGTDVPPVMNRVATAN